MRLIFLLLIFFSFSVNAQPPCSGLGGTPQTAISVCNSFTPSFLPECLGTNLPVIVGNGCASSDNTMNTDNAAWYKVHIYQSGTLGFTIVPPPGADFDWVLFNITNRQPQDVFTTNLVVGYNKCATTGSTGCAAVGTLDYNCSGNGASIPPSLPFNRLLPVLAGQEYLLMIIKYSGNTSNYTLNFTGGTAVVTNNTAPSITNISTVGCNTTQLRVTLSEDVLCTSLNSNGSQFTIPGNTVLNATSLCASGTNAVNTFILNLQNPLPSGSFNLNVAAAPSLNDVCNNPMTTLTYAFTATAQTPAVITQVTQNSCTPTILKVALSKKVLCSSVNTTTTGTEFSVLPGVNTITSIAPICSGTPSLADTVIITLAAPLTQGNYTLNVNINAGGDGNTLQDTCSLSTVNGYSFAFTVPVSPAAPLVTPTISYCINATAIPLTATGTNLLWYTAANGGTGSTTAPTPSTLAAGTVNYYVSQGNGSCESPRSLIAVTVLSNIPIPTVVTPVTKCQFSTPTILTATGTGLLWYPTLIGGTGSATAPTPPTVTAGSIVYYVSQTISGCESPRTPIVVVIATTPLPPTVVSPFSICQTIPAAPLTAMGTNLLWYTAPTGGVGTATAPTPPTAALAILNYYVTQTVGGCESPREDIIVTVDAIPPAPTVPASTISYCLNAPASVLSATGTNLLWYTVPTGGTGTTVTPVPLTSAIGVTTYYVSQSNNSCAGPRTSITVTVAGSVPTLAVTSPINVCQFAPAPTINVLPTPGATLLWYTTLTGGVGSPTTPIINSAVTSNTTYYVTQTNGSCEANPRAALVVNVTATPTAPAVTSPLTYCQNSAAPALTATGTNLLWYATAAGGTGVATAPTLNTAVTSTTNYYVSQSLNSCESPRSLITVNINAAPSTAPTVTTPLNYCVGNATIPLVAAGANLLWFTTATGGVGNNATPTPSSASAGTTIYYVAQSIGACEGPRAPITVNVLAYPAAPTVVSPLVLCPGSTAIPLTALGTNLLWYANAAGGVGSPSAPTPSTAALGSTTYYVSQSNGSCEGPRVPIIVTIANPLVVNIGADVTICEGSSNTFMPTVTPAAGATYEWRPLGATPVSTIVGINNLNATVSPINNAIYVLKASIGSCVREDTVNVNVLWKPIVDAGVNTAICRGDSTLLIGNVTHTTGPILSYDWTPAATLRTPTVMQTYAVPTATTLYTLSVKTDVASYGCDFTSTDDVRVTIQAPITAFAGNDTIAVKGVPHQLYGSGGTNYTWTSPTALIQTPFAKNTKAVLNNDAVFYLKVTDGVGCAGFDTVFVKVYEGPKYYIPSAFTPNGDGNNDVFRAIPVGMANTVYFRVFNRYGELVFETNQWLKGWDGTFKGKDQPNGVYVWMVSGTDRNFNKVNEKGTVNLIR